ncbi:MAG: C4-dicarboxylate ABC transporter, partial [Novibacillus thermophilus]
MIILRKVILTTCPIIILFVSVSCQYGTYPQDHEQLSADERIVIRFSHVVGEDTPKGQASRKFAELVESRTDGYVEVQVFPNSFLYRDGEEFDALLKGDVQMIAPSTSKVTKLVPEWQVIDLPFAFNSDQEVNEYLESPAGQVLWDKL